MRFPAITTAACAALIAAGCGGTQGTGAGASDIVPASAPVLIQIDTDPGSAQWKMVNALAGHFPGKQKAVIALKKNILESGGFDWEKDVKPALGKELDLVGLDLDNGGKDFVALLQPRDESKFADVIRRGNAKDKTATVVYDKFNGWEVLSDSRAMISRFEQASKNEQTSLSDDPGFQRASHELGDAVVRAYVNGPAVMSKLRATIGANNHDLVRKLGTLDWLGANLAATSSGVALNVVLHGTPGTLFKRLHFTSYRSHLASTVPQDALLYWTFHGSGGAFGGLSSTSPVLGAPQFRGFRDVLGQVGKVMAGEDALYVRRAPSAGIPEIALVTEPAPGTDAAATLDRLLRRFRAELHTTPRPTSIAGTRARALRFGSFGIDYANVGNKFVVTNYPDGIWGVKLNVKLAQSPDYEDAVRSAGLPAKTQGYLYVNIHSTVPLVERLAHTPLPNEVRRNLAPLRSVLEYEVARSHELEVSFFLRIR